MEGNISFFQVLYRYIQWLKREGPFFSLNSIEWYGWTFFPYTYFKHASKIFEGFILSSGMKSWYYLSKYWSKSMLIKHELVFMPIQRIKPILTQFLSSSYFGWCLLALVALVDLCCNVGCLLISNYWWVVDHHVIFSMVVLDISSNAQISRSIKRSMTGNIFST